MYDGMAGLGLYTLQESKALLIFPAYFPEQNLFHYLSCIAQRHTLLLIVLPRVEIVNIRIIDSNTASHDETFVPQSFPCLKYLKSFAIMLIYR